MGGGDDDGGGGGSTSAAAPPASAMGAVGWSALFQRASEAIPLCKHKEVWPQDLKSTARSLPTAHMRISCDLMHYPVHSAARSRRCASRERIKGGASTRASAPRDRETIR